MLIELSILNLLVGKIQSCYILQQGCIIIRSFPIFATRLRTITGRARIAAAVLRSLLLVRFFAVSVLSRLLMKQGVLASPWWQRVLAVLPVILLLWLGVQWALGEG